MPWPGAAGCWLTRMACSCACLQQGNGSWRGKQADVLSHRSAAITPVKLLTEAKITGRQQHTRAHKMHEKAGSAGHDRCRYRDTRNRSITADTASMAWVARVHQERLRLHLDGGFGVKLQLPAGCTRAMQEGLQLGHIFELGVAVQQQRGVVRRGPALQTSKMRDALLMYTRAGRR